MISRDRSKPVSDQLRKQTDLGLSVFSSSGIACAQEWQSLLNFHNFDDFERWLATPRSTYDVPGLNRDPGGKYCQVIGLNRDPLGVFTYTTIRDEPVLRISGQARGAITTIRKYVNYRLRAVFKWGDARWEADNYPRNSGILYHAFGEQGGFGAEAASPGAFMTSIEFQLAAGSFGDFIPLGPISSMVRAAPRNNPNFSPTNSWRYAYDQSHDKLEFSGFMNSPNGRRVRHLINAEKQTGEWNTVELVAYGDKVAQIVNGQVTVKASDLRYRPDPKGPLMPLIEGRIQIQSEGAEVFFKSIEIMSLDEMPPELEDL